MSKGNVKKFSKDKGYEKLNRSMLQDIENLSLDAIGLLCNMLSYPDNWTTYKTELYKRYPKSGRRRVERAWNELVDSSYIVQLRKRNGKKYDYIYYFNDERFTEEDIRGIEKEEDCLVWNGKKSDKQDEIAPQNDQPEPKHKKQKPRVINVRWNVHFGHSILNTPKRTYKRYTIKEINYKEKEIDKRLDTTDTQPKTYPHVDNSIQDKMAMRQKYFEMANINNSEKIPKELAKALSVLTDDQEQSNSYYKAIIQAKKAVEKDLDMLILLEDRADIENEIIHILSRTVQKVSTGRMRDNPEGYLYKSIRRSLTDILKPSYDTPENGKLFNWLERDEDSKEH